MISAFISPAVIKNNLESSEKEEAFAELLELLVAKNPGLDRKEAMNALIVREEKMSTAIFPYVAVPHAICKQIDNTLVAVGVSHEGVEFDSADSENTKTVKVNLIFEILFGENETETHLQVLRDILELAGNPSFIKNVLKAKTSQEIYDMIVSLES